MISPDVFEEIKRFKLKRWNTAVYLRPLTMWWCQRFVKDAPDSTRTGIIKHASVSPATVRFPATATDNWSKSAPDDRQPVALDFSESVTVLYHWYCI